MANTIGLDLGSEYTKLCIQGEKDLKYIPTLITTETKTGTLRASGNEAKRMLGRTPLTLTVTKPIVNGLIADIDSATMFVSDTLERLELGSLFKRLSIIATIPPDAAEKEEDATEKTLINAGVSAIDYVDTPIAIALGAGMPHNISGGRMVVDIGAGHIGVSVISHGEVVVSSSVRTAGNAMTEAVKRYVANVHSIEIGENTAELIKIKLGALNGQSQMKSLKINGRMIAEKGGPDKFTASAIITSNELAPLIKPFADLIIDRITATLGETPTEISSDISDFGILLSGGVSALPGLSEYIEKALGISVTTTKTPSLDAAKGILRIISGGHAFNKFLK